jgi:ribosomal protein S18 acetylase RimI-like enzyme
MQILENVIRPVRHTDLARLVEIDAEASGENRETYLAKKMESALDEKWGVIASNVIEVEGEVVGFIMVEVVSGEFGLPEDVARLDTIGILSQYRSKGLAGELFSQTVSQLAKLGISRIQTLVDWNDQELIRYFASQGFSPGKMVFLEKTIAG